jgi:hypothetical protein
MNENAARRAAEHARRTAEANMQQP